MAFVGDYPTNHVHLCGCVRPPSDWESMELARHKRALDNACASISEVYGTCPNDQLGWQHPAGCDDHCGKIDDVYAQCADCWREYFLAEE
jgi:hypothetical protein